MARAIPETRIQVLDVGDWVTHAGLGGEGVITGNQLGTVLDYAVEWADSIDRYTMIRNGWRRSQLIRIGGDLQPGDWVRVKGECETVRSTDRELIDDETGLIVDTYEEAEGPDFLVCVRGLADLYECRADQLTRITRAEALS